MAADLHPTRPSRNVTVSLPDEILDLVDAVRILAPNAPSRSATIKTLIVLGMGVMLDEADLESYVAGLAETGTAGTKVA